MACSRTDARINTPTLPLHRGRLALTALALLAAVAGSSARADSPTAVTKATAPPPQLHHSAGPLGGGTRGGCFSGDVVPYWSGQLDVAIPDNQPVGTFVGSVMAPANGLLIESTQVELEIEHTYAGDLVLGLWYDQNLDGFGDVGPVYLLCTPGLAGCDFDGCCGCDGDLAGTYYFHDNGAGPLGEIACTPVLAGGCFTPDAESPPLSIFQGLPTNGQFLLYAWDYEAGDVGVVHSYTMWLDTGCNHPNLDVPSVYGSITAAVEAACDGDTVRIQPGVYHEGVFFDHEVSRILIKSAVPGQRAIIDGLHFDSNGRCPELLDIEVTGDTYFRGGIGPRFATDCVFHGSLTYTGGNNLTALAGVHATGPISIDGGDAVMINCNLGSVSTSTSYSTVIKTSDVGSIDVNGRNTAEINLHQNTVHADVYLRSYISAVMTMNIVVPPTHGVYGVRLQPTSGGTTAAICNDVWNWQQNWSGIPDPTGTSGNFSLNPRFCDPLVGNFLLDASSPCAFGHHPQGEDCGLYIGAHAVGCTLPVAVGDAPPESMPLVSAQPNPSRWLVSFALTPGTTPALIRIVDAAGRSVREIEVGASSSPRHASWDQSDAAGNRVPAGVYFYRVRSGERESTKQLVVLH